MSGIDPPPMQRARLPFSVAIAQGAPMHGCLELPPAACAVALFLAVNGSDALALRGGLADMLHAAGIATCTADLLDAASARYADAGAHLPMLTERLLALLSYLHRLMDSETIPTLPIALVAAGDTTPVAIRAAAIRDSAVSRVVAIGGLVDLAGLQYLQAMRAPLLMLLSPDDGMAEANLARARGRMTCRIDVARLPTATDDEAHAAARIRDWLSAGKIRAT